MKKLQILMIAFLISLSIFAFASEQVKAATLTASIAPVGPLTMNVGQQQTFAATASGGTGTKSYQWYLDGSAVSGQTTSTYLYTAALPSHTIYVKVNDSAVTPETAQSNVVSVTVNAALTASIAPPSWIMDVEQSKTFTSTPAGGSGNYSSYQWYVGSIPQSGQTNSTFTYSPITSGSYLLTVSVTDSSGATSAQSIATSVTVNNSPTVSVSPVGPVTLDVDQVQNFTATSSGGSGSLSYQWYLDGSAVGSNSSRYSYAAAGTSHSVTCRVSDSGSVPITSNSSNAVSITVNPKLVAPTVTSTPGTINQDQTSSLTSSAVSGGTPPYTYQWLQMPPDAVYYSSIPSATSSSYSFNPSIDDAIGIWNFMLQVKDYAGEAKNSSAVSVTVNIPPIDHFVFSSIGTQTAGTLFSITITAKDASNNTLKNYGGTNILNVSSGTINPISTGSFSKGVWTGSVKVTSAVSEITIFTTGSSMSGTSNIFTVYPGAVDTFAFSTINSPQIDGSAFSITVMAKDIYGNTVTGYTGTPSLTYSVGSGSISPSTMNAFVGGVGSTSVTVNSVGSGVTITTTDGSISGISNSFIVTLAPTPSQTSNPTATPTPTIKPEPSPTFAPTPSPTSSFTGTTVTGTTENGATFNLAINGNVTGSQISNVKIFTNQTAASITVSYIITAQSGTTGFSNITIPKTAIPNGASPVIFIDGKQAANQGYTQDVNNFFVWCTMQFSTHQVKIQFALSSTSQATTFGSVLAVGITVPEIILIYAVIAVRRLKRKPDNA
jgi:hypothetical protein